MKILKILQKLITFNLGVGKSLKFCFDDGIIINKVIDTVQGNEYYIYIQFKDEKR